MNEKELAIQLTQSLKKATKEKDLNIYATSIRLNDNKLKDINVDLLINEIKNLGFYCDYQKNVKYHRYTKEDKNSLFISIEPFNN